MLVSYLFCVLSKTLFVYLYWYCASWLQLLISQQKVLTNFSTKPHVFCHVCHHVVIETAYYPEFFLFQQHLAAAIMPPVAFTAVPRLPQPPFECQLLPPDAMTEQSPKSALQPASGCSDDTGSLHDYQQQASPVLWQHCKFAKHSEQPV